MEPDNRPLIIILIIKSITPCRRNYILESENFAWLIVILLHLAAALNFSGTFTSEGWHVGEGAIYPPNNTLRTILALLKNLQILLIVRVIQNRGPPRRVFIVNGFDFF